MADDLTQDPLAPYRLEAPLTEAELTFLDHLRGDEDGRGLLAALGTLGFAVRAETAGRAARLLVEDGRVSPDAVVEFFHNSLGPYAERHWHAGMHGLALGGFGLGLRCCLVVLDDQHATALEAIDDVGVCTRSTGRPTEALTLNELAYEERKRVLGDDHSDTLQSLNNLAVCLTDLGRADEALPRYKAAHEAQKRVLGEDHPDTLQALSNLAYCLMSLDRTDEALACYEAAYEDRKRALGEDHPDTLGNLNNLAACLGALGRSGEALPHHEATYEACKRVLGGDHPDTLTSLSNLAECVSALGQVGEALPLAEATYEGRRRVLGEDHPDTLQSLNYLAACLDTLGRAGEALPFREAAHAACMRLLGEDHPNTLIGLNKLAGCLEALGQAGKALPRYEQAYKACMRVFGEDHPNTFACLNNLALCLHRLGRASEALPLHEAVYEPRKRVLGEDHPDTLTSLSNLAACLHWLGREGEALPLNEAAYKARKRVLGEDHPDTLMSVNNLAGCLKRLGRVDEALPYVKAAYEGNKRLLGVDHPNTLTSLGNLAACLDALGRAGEALHRHEAAYEAQKRVLGEDHPDTLTSLSGLADCVKALGRMSKALSLYNAAYEARKWVLGEDHPDTLGSLNNLTLCVHELGLAGEALPHFEATYEARKRVLGKDHSDTLVSLNNLAGCLGDLGRAGEALPLYEAVYEAQKRVLSADHPLTLSILSNLARCLEALGRDEPALGRWLELAGRFEGLPQPGRTWLRLFENATTALARHARVGRLEDWGTPLEELSATLRAALDLQEPEQLDVARPSAARFFATYLGLCLDLGRLDRVPAVLAAVQGRKLAALVLDELEVEELEPGSLRGRFQALRVELRRLALGLRVVEGGRSGPSGDGARDAEAEMAGQREQLAAYRETLGAYRELRAELEETDPDFAAAAAVLAPSLDGLRARLSGSEALALLFERHDEDERTSHALVITARGEALVALGAAATTRALGVTRLWPALQHRAGRGVLRRESTETEEKTAPEELDALLPDGSGFEEVRAGLAEAMVEGLWGPLSKEVDGVRHLHLVSQGELHLLPYDLGRPEGLQLSSYPGLVYYHLLRHQGGDQMAIARPDGALGLAAHGAEDSAFPLPLVRAEVRLLERLWPGGVDPAVDLGEPEPELGCFQALGHGDHDPVDPTRAGLNLGGGESLDFHRVLGGRRRPPVVFLSACMVGRVTDDPDGDPLGLMGAFFLRGAEYVIASLQPVSDFYMPLLACLFHQAWQQTGGPAAALAEARRRLREGDWYEDTESLLRDAYAPVLDDWLARDSITQANEVDLAKLTHDWPFAPPYGNLDPNAHQHRLKDLRKALADTDGRSAVINGILDRLSADRSRLPVDDICTWVRGFGEARSGDR